MKRILVEHPRADVGPHGPSSVVAAQAVGHLGQVVRAEAEEIRVVRDFGGPQSRARRLDRAKGEIGALIGDGATHSGLTA